MADAFREADMVADEQNLIRRGGWALAAGGVLHVVATVLHPSQETPATLDHVVMYPPVVAFNAIAAIAFIGGFVTLGIALSKSRTFSGWSGVLVAVGAPMHLIGAGVAQLAAPGLWFVAVLGAAALGVGLALCGSRMAGRIAAR